MLKTSLKRILIQTLLIFGFSLIYLGVGYIIGILISNKYTTPLQDVMTYEGLLLFLLGAIMSMKGNPSGMGFGRIGSDNVNITTYLDNEITSQDRETNPYHKDFLKNNMVEFSHSSLTFILGGILIFVFSAVIL